MPAHQHWHSPGSGPAAVKSKQRQLSFVQRQLENSQGHCSHTHSAEEMALEVAEGPKKAGHAKDRAADRAGHTLPERAWQPDVLALHTHSLGLLDCLPFNTSGRGR